MKAMPQYQSQCSALDPFHPAINHLQHPIPVCDLAGILCIYTLSPQMLMHHAYMYMYMYIYAKSLEGVLILILHVHVHCIYSTCMYTSTLYMHVYTSTLYMYMYCTCTYVKSCRITLAGRNGISTFLCWFSYHARMLSTSLELIWNPSQFLTTDSSSTRTEYGNRSTQYTRSIKISSHMYLYLQCIYIHVHIYACTFIHVYTCT